MDPVRKLILEMAGKIDGGLKAMSLAAGKSHSYLQQFIARGTPRTLPEDVRERLAQVYGVPVEALKTGGSYTPNPRTPPRRTGGEVQEVDARAGAGLGAEAMQQNMTVNGRDVITSEPAIATWRLPPDYLRYELRVPQMAARLVEVLGDSMSPTLLPGDRILVNTADRRPSPPGIFALWDGLGVVVKRLDHIPHSDPPALRIISDNPNHPDYERTAEEVQIIGRVVWYGRRI